MAVAVAHFEACSYRDVCPSARCRSTGLLAQSLASLTRDVVELFVTPLIVLPPTMIGFYLLVLQSLTRFPCSAACRCSARHCRSHIAHQALPGKFCFLGVLLISKYQDDFALSDDVML